MSWWTCRRRPRRARRRSAANRRLRSTCAGEAHEESPMPAKYKPDGQHTVTPYLTVVGVKRLLEFLEKGLGARLRNKHDGPGGKVMHAEVEIGDSRVIMGEA